MGYNQITLTLIRKKVSANLVFGSLYYGNDFICHTLERPWKMNKRDISCIPANVTGYKCKFNPNTQNGNGSFVLFNVIDRDNIQIHKGNFVNDTTGCVLVGFNFSDTQTRLYESEKAFDLIKTIVKKETFVVSVLDETGKTYTTKALQVVDTNTDEWRDIAKKYTTLFKDPYPEPDHKGPKIPFYIKAWAWLDGKKTALGTIGLLGSQVLKAAGQVEVATALEVVSYPLTVGGVAHKAYKSQPATNGKAGVLYTILQKLINWINRGYTWLISKTF